MKRSTLPQVLLLISVLITIRSSAQSAAATAASDAVPGNTVVVKVDGKDITADEIRAAVQNMPPEFTGLYQRNPTYAVQQLFLMRHLAQEAEQKQLGDKTPLKEQLALLRANVLASAMISYQQNSFQPPAEVAQAYYNANKSKYQRAKVKGIALTYRAKAPSMEEIAKAAAEGKTPATARTQAETLKLAADLVGQLRHGADFSKLAAQYSDDPVSKAANGDFSPVDSASSYPDTIKQAIYALKPGEVSEPIAPPGNPVVYIFRLEEISAQPFAEVAAPVSEELRKQHMNEWMQSLAKQFAPVVENRQFFGMPPAGITIAPGSPVMSAPGASPAGPPAIPAAPSIPSK